MDERAAPATAPGADTPPAQSWNEPRPRIGVRVEVFTTSPGVVELGPLPDHRLRVHAGPPVRGTCGLQRFRYTHGDVDIFPAGLSDVWEEDEGSTSVVLRLSPWLLRRAAEEIGVGADRAGLEPRHQLRDPQIEHIAWALDAERRAGFPSGLLYTESLGMALAVHLIGRHTTSTPLPRGLSKAQLQRVTDYVEDNLDRDLTLARLAGLAGVSASHFKTLFKRSTGVPAHRYVVQRRVARARALLLRGELPASQVALAAGFAHQGHMARWMRRILGVAPTSLVRSARGGSC